MLKVRSELWKWRFLPRGLTRLEGGGKHQAFWGKLSIQKALYAACPVPDNDSVGWKELPVALQKLVLIFLGLSLISEYVDSNTEFLQ